MSEQEAQKAQEFEYRAEMRQLLHLIIHSLYTNQEIFLRELISNASDALNKARFRQLTGDQSSGAGGDFRITITLDKDANTLSIEDTGIGMSRSDLTDRLGTIASSGTLAFLEEIKASGKPVDGSMIGQFGVGFYSSFMVASRVDIQTLCADDDAEPLHWSSDGAGTYAIAPGERTTPGTCVTLHLKEDAKDYATDYRVRSIIQKYSNFVDFPIYLGSDQVNTIKALWKKRKDDVTDEERSEFYKFVAGGYDDPFGHLHLQIEGVVKFDALLFIPAKAPPTFFQDKVLRHIHLYSSGVYIRDDADDLLPDYLRFIRGVVDTDDLPLNVSREVTQDSPVASKIRSILTTKFLGMLAEWAEDDSEKYDRFFAEFGNILKIGLWSDFARREELLGLMRYPSTKTKGEETTSPKAYVDAMPEDQEAIYYLLSDSLVSARRSPNLEAFKRKGIEVLLLADPIDAVTIPNLQEFDGKPFKSVAQSDVGLDDAESESEALPGSDTDTLLALFRVQLGDRVQDVVASKRLVDSAVTLVSAADGMDPQFERLMRSMNSDFEGSKKVLEVNTAHPLMKNITTLHASGDQGDVVERAIEQVYEGAVLLDGNLSEPAEFVSRMTDILVDATRAA